MAFVTEGQALSGRYHLVREIGRGAKRFQDTNAKNAA